MQNLWDSKISKPPLEGLSPPGTRQSPVDWAQVEAQVHSSSCPRCCWETPKLQQWPAAVIRHWKNASKKKKKGKLSMGWGSDHSWAGRKKKKPERSHRSVTLVLGYLFVCCSLQLALNVIGFGGLFCIIVIGKHWWDIMKKRTYPYTLEDSFVTISS